MTDQITVPRATWDAMREALETCTYTSSYDKSFDIVKVEEALAAANAVSDQDLPIGKCGVLSKSEPQAQGEAVYLVATGETHNGEETYCRYDYPPALSEFERLYTHPQATEPAWRPIETAPKNGALYLAIEGADMWVENAPEGHFAGVLSWSESRRQWRGHAHSDDRFATHWMSLPSPPKDDL